MINLNLNLTEFLKMLIMISQKTLKNGYYQVVYTKIDITRVFIKKFLIRRYSHKFILS